MALSATFAADFRSFTDACAKAEQSLKGIEAGAGQVEQSLNKVGDSLQGTKLIQQATIAAEAVKRLGGEGGTAAGLIQLTDKELQKLGGTAQEAASKLTALGQNVPADIKKIADAAAAANKEVVSLATRLKDVGQTSLQAGTALTAGITAPLAAIGGFAVKAAIDFETAFAGVRKTVTGTKPELDAINLQFREMAKVLPVSAVELSKIGETAGQLGVHKENIVDFTKTIVNISTATNLTADEAATSFAKLANVMKIPQEQFANLGSAVYALGNFGASTEQEMLNMAQRISAAGASAGFTAPQVLGIANALASVGIEAEAGGTAVSRVITKMASDVASGGGHLRQFAETAEQYLGGLGGSVGTASEKFQKAFKEDAGKAFSAFIEGLSHVKDKGESLFDTMDELGFKEVRLKNAMLAAANAGDIVKDSMVLSGKSFADTSILVGAATERMKTAENQLKVFKQNVEDVAISLGNALLPFLIKATDALKPMVKGLDEVAQWFGKLPEPVQLTGIAIAGAAAAVGPLLLAFGGVARGVSSIIDLYEKLVPATTAAKTVTLELAAAEDAAALSAKGLLLSLGPVVTILAGIGYAYVKSREAIDEFTKAHGHAQREVIDLTARANPFSGQISAIAQKEYDASVAADQWANSVKRANEALAKIGETPSTGKVSGTAAFRKDADLMAESATTAAKATAILTDAQKSANAAAALLAKAQIDLDPELRRNLETMVATHAPISAIEKALKEAGIEGDKYNLVLAQMEKAQSANNTAAEKFATGTLERNAALQRLNELMGDQFDGLELTAGEWARLAIVTKGSLSDIHLATGLSLTDLEAWKKNIDAVAASQTKFDHDMQTNADRTAVLISETAALEIKASHDTVAAKKADVDTWVQKQIDALNKLKISDQAYVTGVVAILRRGAADKSAIDADAAVKHQQALDKQREAEERTAQQTAAIWARYADLIEKAKGNTVGGQIAAIERNSQAQLQAIEAGLNKELDAIRHNNDLKATEQLLAAGKAIEAAKLQSQGIIAIAELEKTALKDALTADWMALGAHAIAQIAEGFRSGNALPAISQAGQAISQKLLDNIELTVKQKAGIAIGQAIGQAVGGTNIGEEIGATIGLAVGAAFAGPLGAAVGSAVGGAVGGWIDRIHQGHQISNAVKDVANEMGLALSQGLATGIAATAENIQKMDSSLSAATARHYAELLQLDKIIVEQGGLTTANMQKWAGQAERLFEVIRKGGELGKAATQELSNVLDMFAQEATKGSGLWDDAFKQLIADAAKAGVDIDKINKLILGQETLGASKIGAAAKITADAYAQQAKDLETLSGLQAQLAGASEDSQKSIQAEIDKTNADLKIQMGIIAATGITSQGAADAMAAAIEGGIAAAMAGGQSFVQAVLSQKDAVNALQTDMEKAGLAGGAAWDFIKGQVDLATDAIAGPALQALESNTAGIVALANAGQLSAGQFAALEERIGATATALEAQGKSSDQVMAAIQGDLQVAWELENKYGIKLDETTQKLVDEALAAGTVGEAHKTANDQIIDGINRLIDHLDLLLKAFGVDIPAAMGQTATAATAAATQTANQFDGTARHIENAFHGISSSAQLAAQQTQNAWDSVDVTIPFSYELQGGIPDLAGAATVGGSGGVNAPSFAKEGFVSKATLAVVGDSPGGEYILHKSTVDALMASVGRASAAPTFQPAAMLGANSLSSGMGDVTVTIEPIESAVTLDGLEVGRVWMRLGAREVMRRGKSRR